MHKALKGLPQGWFHHGERILSLIEKYAPKVCVELGTWKGASAIAIARVLKEWDGELFCVDTWTGDVDYGHWGTVAGAPAMLLECATNVVAAGVADRVRFIPARTVEAAESWSMDIDMLYVDADHTYESTRDDIAAWYSFLGPGGIFFGDDYDNPMYPGVKKAWDEFALLMEPSMYRVEKAATNPPGMKLVWGIK